MIKEINDDKKIKPIILDASKFSLVTFLSIAFNLAILTPMIATPNYANIDKIDSLDLFENMSIINTFTSLSFFENHTSIHHLAISSAAAWAFIHLLICFSLRKHEKDVYKKAISFFLVGSLMSIHGIMTIKTNKTNQSFLIKYEKEKIYNLNFLGKILLEKKLLP